MGPIVPGNDTRLLAALESPLLHAVGPVVSSVLHIGRCSCLPAVVGEQVTFGLTLPEATFSAV